MLAKSKLNNIENLVSQALIDMEISHEEYIAVLKEKDKYEKMKENLRSKHEKQEIMQYKTKDLSEKLLSILCHQKEFIFFLCMYKMVQISKEEYEKCEVEIIDKGRYFQVNRRDLEESDVPNWAQIFDKCDTEKQKYQEELTPNAEYQRLGCLCEMIQSKEKLKAVESHQKEFQNSKKSQDYTLTQLLVTNRIS